MWKKLLHISHKFSTQRLRLSDQPHQGVVRLSASYTILMFCFLSRTTLRSNVESSLAIRFGFRREKNSQSRRKNCRDNKQIDENTDTRRFFTLWNFFFVRITLEKSASMLYQWYCVVNERFVWISTHMISKRSVSFHLPTLRRECRL